MGLPYRCNRLIDAHLIGTPAGHRKRRPETVQRVDTGEGPKRVLAVRCAPLALAAAAVRLGWVLLIVCWPLYAADNQAKTAPTSAAELERVRQEMKAIAQRVQSTRKSRDAQSQALRRIEVARGQTRGELRDLAARVAVAEEQADVASQERTRLTELAAEHRRAAAKVLRSSHRTGRHDRIRLILSQTDPATIGRSLQYAALVRDARLARLEPLRRAIVDLEEATKRERQVAARLESLREDKATTLATLDSQRLERQSVIRSLNVRLDDDQARLSRLAEDENRLAALVDALKKELAATLKVPERKPFARQRGKLPWPAQGRIVRRFGASRIEGHLRWQGVLIDAPEGSPVRAVSHGRVAYAEWLRGYGLLLIIDHGDGYMSLYGHNRSIQKQVGDWVSDGEVVAWVGDSGGQDRAGLYFEIRRAGEPQNPARWCRGTPTGARRG